MTLINIKEENENLSFLQMKKSIIAYEIMNHPNDTKYHKQIVNYQYYNLGEFHGKKLSGISHKKGDDISAYYLIDSSKQSIEDGLYLPGLKGLDFYKNIAKKGELFREDTTGFYRIKNGKEKKLEYDSKEYFEFMMDLSSEETLRRKKGHIEGTIGINNIKNSNNLNLYIDILKDCKDTYEQGKEYYEINQSLEKWNIDEIKTIEEAKKYLNQYLIYRKEQFGNIDLKRYLEKFQIFTFTDLEGLLKTGYCKKGDAMYTAIIKKITSYYSDLLLKKYPISGYLVNKEELEIAKKYLNPEKYKSIEALFYGREDIKKSTQKELKKAKE